MPILNNLHYTKARKTVKKIGGLFLFCFSKVATPNYFDKVKFSYLYIIEVLLFILSNI